LYRDNSVRMRGFSVDVRLSQRLKKTQLESQERLQSVFSGLGSTIYHRIILTLTKIKFLILNDGASSVNFLLRNCMLRNCNRITILIVSQNLSNYGANSTSFFIQISIKKVLTLRLRSGLRIPPSLKLRMGKALLHPASWRASEGRSVHDPQMIKIPPKVIFYLPRIY